MAGVPTSRAEAASQIVERRPWTPSRADLLGVLGDHDRLQVVTQPIIDLAGGRIVGYELLSRFAAGTPDLWFAVAAELGLSAHLDAVVIGRAIALRDALPANTFLTVNVEPHDLLHPAVQQRLLGAGDLSRLVIELTEHARIEAFEPLIEPLRQLRERGALIAADDVGSGYAGLQSLLAVRPEIVKIDRSIVDGVDGDPAKQAVVRMLGELSNRMDAWVLAEGIEREAELVELMRLGVPLAQGYLLGRPSPSLTTTLPISATAVIHGQNAALSAADSLEALIEVVPLIPTVHDAVSAVGHESISSDETVIEIDAWGRPIAVIADCVRTTSPLTAHPTEEAHDTAERMVGRSGPLVPIVVVNADGRAQGLVRPKRLLGRLAAVAARQHQPR